VQLAMFHTIFNVVAVFLILPLTEPSLRSFSASCLTSPKSPRMPSPPSTSTRATLSRAHRRAAG
jgi:hypothetical protein